MTIDEAIKHCEDVAHNNDITKQQMDECDYGYGIFLLCPLESKAESEGV